MTLFLTIYEDDEDKETTLKVQTADFVSSLAALLTSRAPEESSTESTAASEAASREATPREAVAEAVAEARPGKLTWKVKGAEKSEEGLIYIILQHIER